MCPVSRGLIDFAGPCIDGPPALFAEICPRRITFDYAARLTRFYRWTWPLEEIIQFLQWTARQIVSPSAARQPVDRGVRDPGDEASVKSAVMLALWDRFRREGIRVPYPVRKSASAAERCRSKVSG